jgi:hypothetical protein
MAWSSWHPDLTGTRHATAQYNDTSPSDSPYAEGQAYQGQLSDDEDEDMSADDDDDDDVEFGSKKPKSKKSGQVKSKQLGAVGQSSRASSSRREWACPWRKKEGGVG